MSQSSYNPPITVPTQTQSVKLPDVSSLLSQLPGSQTYERTYEFVPEDVQDIVGPLPAPNQLPRILSPRQTSTVQPVVNNNPPPTSGQQTFVVPPSVVMREI